MEIPSGNGSTAAGTVNAVPVGLEIEYNHDLDVAEEFLAVYPSIREALKDQRLLKKFVYFDRVARTHKRSFQLLGLWSLVLGLVPLVVAALRMTVGESAFAGVADIGVVSELCGVASVASFCGHEGVGTGFCGVWPVTGENASASGIFRSSSMAGSWDSLSMIGLRTITNSTVVGGN